VTVQLLIPAKILEEEEDDLLFYCFTVFLENVFCTTTPHGVVVQKTFSRKENK